MDIKRLYHVVSFSGGKDSTAMLLHMLELGMPVDEVLNVDTGMEFPAMYDHIEKVKKIVAGHGIKFTTLKAPMTFEHMLTKHLVCGRNMVIRVGYGWPDAHVRWCTSRLKTELIKKHVGPLKKRYEVLQYVGLAADERYRLSRKGNTADNQNHPLVDWGWTEADALNYCKSRGFDWGGLYDLFRRVSCWCCPLQRLNDLRILRRYFPELWQRLQDLDKQQWKQFKDGWTVAQLEARFALEDERTAQGLTISARNKEFKAALKNRLYTQEEERQ